MNEEAFLKKFKDLSELKLRLGSAKLISLSEDNELICLLKTLLK